MLNPLFNAAVMRTYPRPTQSVNRENLITKSIAKDLNTYKNFGIFRAYNDGYSITWGDDMKDKKVGSGDSHFKVGAPAVRSIFNKYSHMMTGNKDTVNMKGRAQQAAAISKYVFNHKHPLSEWRLANNVPLMDTPDVRKELRRQSGCSVKELVEASQKGYYGRAGYSYADFMYCKYLGQVSNNYLITLRRFASPINDSIMPCGTGATRAMGNEGSEANIPAPVGTMVTWLGVSGNEMSSILKYSYKMAFKSVESKWEDINKIGGGDNGILNGLEALVNPATRKMYGEGKTIPALDNFLPKFFKVGAGTYDNTPHYDDRKVYGPIDRVKTTYMRGEDGLQWDYSPTIVFEYELKAYNGINPKQAMLDLIASILSVTYTTGGFWPGGYRGMAIRQSSTFQNLNIFKRTGSFTSMMDAFSQDLHNGVGAMKSTIKDLGNGDTLKGVAKFLNQIGGMLVGGLINSLGRPAKYYANSLLSEAPVGFWHLTVGNPNHPIFTSGNMIIKNCTIEHSGPLGLDDFPSNLKVTVELDRGKPRDQYGVEALYMGGNDRIFHASSRKVLDMYTAAKEYQTGGNYIDWDAKNVDDDMEVKQGSEEAREVMSLKDFAAYIKSMNPEQFTDALKSEREGGQQAEQLTKKSTGQEDKSKEKDSFKVMIPTGAMAKGAQDILIRYFGDSGDDTRRAIIWAAREQAEGSDTVQKIHHSKDETTGKGVDTSGNTR